MGRAQISSLASSRATSSRDGSRGGMFGAWMAKAGQLGVLRKVSVVVVIVVTVAVSVSVRNVAYQFYSVVNQGGTKDNHAHTPQDCALSYAAVQLLCMPPHTITASKDSERAPG
jgi:hypothetical protein